MPRVELCNRRGHDTVRARTRVQVSNAVKHEGRHGQPSHQYVVDIERKCRNGRGMSTEEFDNQRKTRQHDHAAAGFGRATRRPGIPASSISENPQVAGAATAQAHEKSQIKRHEMESDMDIDEDV